jgi:hypothetical protein
VREQFGNRGRVIVRFGLRPKRAIPLRTDEPFAKIVVSFNAPNGAEGQIEVLGNGQQCVVNGVHPDTKQPYEWFGGEPGEVRWQDLPCVTEQDLRQFIADAASVLEQEGYEVISDKPKADSPADDVHDADWGGLVDNITHGHELHDSTRDLAAKLLVSGMGDGAAVNFLRGLYDKSTCEHDERWRERYNDIPRAVSSAREKFTKTDKPAAEPPPQKSLAEVHAAFKKWLGEEYDLDAANGSMAATASERLSGDPLWLLIMGGPGSAKTETCIALAGAGAHVTSTIASEGALLSATPRRERNKKATGGLLRKIGNRGVLVIKDVTSILSSDRNTRAGVLAALREVYDGLWERNVGTDGGQTLTWTGRIVIVGAVTTAWDAAHAVVATMGDRFVLLRPKTESGRLKAGLGAIRNTGGEKIMRQELAAAVGGLIGHMNTTEYQLSDTEALQLLKAANIVTLARSAVERDYRGEVAFAHDPEMPTRFAKQLVQLLRGGVAIGMTPADAMRLALRCARDSIPPLRREILLDLANNPDAQLSEVRKRISKPRNTVRRELDCLHMLDLLRCDETSHTGSDGKRFTIWRYRLTEKCDETTLRGMADQASE